MREGIGRVFGRRGFLPYAFSQCAAAFGDSFLAVASALLLKDKTGSSLLAGLSALFPPACGLLASVFAGHLGDRFGGKRLLFAGGLLKGLLFLLLAFAKPVGLCYFILFLVSLANIFYGVPARKYVATLLPQKELLAGNSVLNGFTGLAYFLGPMLAGLLVGVFGSSFTLLLGGCLHIASTAIVLFLPVAAAAAGTGEKMPAGLKEGALYCVRNGVVRRTIMVYFVLSLFSSATNLAFYPYAFDRLRASPSEWGIVVAVFNGASVLAAALVLLMRKKLRGSFGFPICLCCLVTAGAWLGYGVCGSFTLMLPFLMAEGASVYVCAMLLTTRFQLASGPGILARVIGFGDFAANAGRLLGMGFSALLLLYSGPSAVFICSSMALALFSALFALPKGAKPSSPDVKNQC